MDIWTHLLHGRLSFAQKWTVQWDVSHVMSTWWCKDRQPQTSLPNPPAYGYMMILQFKSMQYLCLFLLANVVMYVFALYFCRAEWNMFLSCIFAYTINQNLMMYVLSFLMIICFPCFFVIELPVLWYYVKSTPAISCDVNSKWQLTKRVTTIDVASITAWVNDRKFGNHLSMKQLTDMFRKKAFGKKSLDSTRFNNPVILSLRHPNTSWEGIWTLQI